MNLGLASFPRGLGDLLTWLVPTGTGMDYWGTTLPKGFVWGNGQTLAIAQYPRLYKVFGTTYGGDGITTFAVPDKRGRMSAGKDDMGGAAAANRITNAGSGIVGTTLGASGGAETVALATANVPAHTHGITTGTQSADHTHTTTTGTVSADHTHTTTTGGVSANHYHASSMYTSFWAFDTGGSAGSVAQAGGAYPIIDMSNMITGYISADHSHTGTSGGISANHTHTGTSGGVSANHTHSGTTDNGSGSGTAVNKMNPVIICNYIIKT